MSHTKQKTSRLEGRGFELRPYQEEALLTFEKLYNRGVNRQLLAAATGLGKTVIFSHLPEAFPDLARRGMMVVAHRRELVFQAAETLREVWPQLRVEIEMAGHSASQRADIVVSSIQTLAHPKSQRLQKYDPASDIGILVIDEAHHCSTGSQYQTVCDHFGVGPGEEHTLENGRDRFLLGVTATPNRHDGEGLHHFFDDIAENYDIRWGIKNGWLVDIDAQRIETDTDLSDVDSRGDDFVASQLQDAVNTHERNDVIVAAYDEHGGDQGLAFCAGVDQAHTLADAFETYGHAAEAIDASTEKIRRKDIVRRYKAGDLEVLTNVGVATEGFDVPPCDTLLMARPTKSTTLYTQMVGRGTRPCFNPTAGTAGQRRGNIQQSRKPHMKILDFCDQVGDHDLMTAPQLFGLDPEYETGSETLTEAREEVDRMQEEHPGKPFEKAQSLEEIDVIAEQVSVWDVAESSVDELGDETDLFWMQLSDDVLQLQIPHEPDGYDVTQDVTMRLERDRLGRWQTIEQKQPVYRDGQMVLKPFEQEGKRYSTKEEALEAMDRYVRRKYADAMPLISKGMDWQDRPATKGQLKYLRRLDVHIPDGEDLSRGKASRLINAAKTQS
jgi:ATP-dependent helicase IRC3